MSPITYQLTIFLQVLFVKYIYIIGRGRAEDSRSIILVYSDSGIVPREMVNDTRTELAHKVLEKIRTLDSNDLKSQVSSLLLQ